ncbi:hypothetical protein SBADM41S_04415 [Streptomyces badius]
MSPPSTLPGVCENVSQMEGERPSSATAPSIWYAAVATPQVKSAGSALRSDTYCLSVKVT